MRREQLSTRARTHPSSRRRAAVALGLVLGLAGCSWWSGSPETPPAPAATTTRPSASDSPMPSVTPSPSPSVTPSPSPTVTPSPAATTPTPSSSPTATPSPDGAGTTGPTPAVPFFANTLPDTGAASGDDVGTLSDLRLGAHPGYDRVVLEFNGPATPSWHVRYVDRAIADGSGFVIPVDGGAILEITCFPVAVPYDGRDPYTGPATLRAAGTTAIVEVTWWSIFEGDLQAFVGVSGGEHPFRAFALSDPARIVVDVRTD